jgi:hypothetical protein
VALGTQPGAFVSFNYKLEDNLDIGAITGIYAGCLAAFILVVGCMVAGSMYAIIKMAVR